MKSPLLLLLFCLTCVAATARPPQSTSRGALRVSPDAGIAPQATERHDTIHEGLDSLVSLRAYDKPLRATRETFHVTSHCSERILAMGVRIEYLSLGGSPLHAREAEVELDLEPGATTLASLRSWDRNHSYFYRLGPQPRTSGVIPYDVRITVRYVVTDR